MSRDDRWDGTGARGRPSRHRPPTRTATADTARGRRERAHLPGPPGDINTARHATDTWGSAGAAGTAAPNEPRTAKPEGAPSARDRGGAEGSG